MKNPRDLRQSFPPVRKREPGAFTSALLSPETFKFSTVGCMASFPWLRGVTRENEGGWVINKLWKGWRTRLEPENFGIDIEIRHISKRSGCTDGVTVGPEVCFSQAFDVFSTRLPEATFQSSKFSALQWNDLTELVGLFFVLMLMVQKSQGQPPGMYPKARK